jgi:uncharacterized protein (TIGR02145 family)
MHLKILKNKRLNLCTLLLFGFGIIISQAQVDKTASSVIDIDGNVYKTITIGNQIWIAGNLKTTRYRNGDTIGSSTPATLDIRGESTPKYQWAYEGNDSNVGVFGRLYTWYVVSDPRNICPIGWHVPTKIEFETLLSNLGGKGLAGYQALLVNGNSGFSALFAGIRVGDGHFEQMRSNCNAVFWSSTASDDGYAWFMSNYSGRQDAHLYAGPYGPLSTGCSVRCIKD